MSDYEFTEEDLAHGPCPHASALSIELGTREHGIAEMALPYAAHLVGDPSTGVIHGGAVATLLDTCCGTSVMVHDMSPISTATLGLRIDYMRSATPGQAIRARAECYHITHTVAFVRATAVDDDAENPVATATGTFAVTFAEGSGK